MALRLWCAFNERFMFTVQFIKFSVLSRRYYSNSDGMSYSIVTLPEVKRFVKDAMMAVGTCDDYAQDLADLLATADYRGHYSHGLNRLEMYVNDVRSGTCEPNAKPRILKESPSTAWVDGNNGLGIVVGNFCMDLAIEKAKKTGVGWVVTKESNHFGIAGWYTLKAVNSGILGMSFTNTSPLMSPTRSKSAALGTNPISVGAPAENGDSFMLDMATTAVAVGKIEVQQRKKEPIPEGWAQGPEGSSTTDADVAFETGCLMPLGGEEHTSGYKGYGLGILVETFCGILSDSKYGPNVRKWMAIPEEKANLGQCFVAIDPNCFAPGFEIRMSDLLNHLRNMEPSNPEKPVLVPGDPERIHMSTVDKQGGISYHVNQIKSLIELANDLKVEPMKLK